MKDDNFIIKLIGLSSFLERQENLDDSLQELANMAASMLNVNNCSIMLLKDDETSGEVRLRISSASGYLPEEAYQETAKLNEGIAGHVAATGKALLIEDIENSKFSTFARRKKNKNKGFLSAPISVNEKTIGVINVNNPKDSRLLRQEDLNLLSLITLFIGKSIQVIQLQKLLRSRYAQFAMSKEAEKHISDTFTSSIPDINRLSKILARTFYNEMTKAGFGIDQIISVATEILSLLGDKLKKYRDRRDRS